MNCDNDLISNWKVPEPFKGELAWIKVYGGSNEDIAKSIIGLSEGGFAVIGNSNSTDGDFSEKTSADRDLFLMKLRAAQIGLKFLKRQKKLIRQK